MFSSSGEKLGLRLYVQVGWPIGKESRQIIKCSPSGTFYFVQMPP